MSANPKAPRRPEIGNINAARQIGLLAWNDLRRTLRDRPSFIWMLLLPLAFMWIFGQMGGGGPAEAPKISLGVEDRDGGWLARALVEELEDDRVALREVGESGEEEADKPIRVLVIPPGFTAGALAGEQQALRLEVDADSSESFDIAAQAHAFRALGRILARMVEMAPGAQDPETGADDTGAEARLEEFRRLAARPPRVDLAVSTAGRGRPIPSGYSQSVPGTLTMIVLMMTVIYGGVFLTEEKQTRMLLRQATLPMTRGQVFLGKLGGRLMVAGVQIAVLLAAGRFLFGVSWGSSTLGLLMVLGSYALAVAGLSTLLGALLRTPEQASGVGWISSMMLAALGGCWWPAEIMPSWMRTASHALPTAWAMDGFHALVSFGRGADAVVVPTLVLLGFAVLFTALGARFLRFE